MFLDFYGLREQPFGVTPDPKYLYWTASHREALASIHYGLLSNLGFVALIAPPGLGKTTLLFHLLEKMRGVARTAFVFQTQCSPHEFLRYVMADLGCPVDEHDPVALHARLNNMLIEQASAGKRFVLIIDEAQNLDRPVLETVRLLSDFETPSRKLIQIVLAGQPRLGAQLASYGMVQLRQRISIAAQLHPLSPAEVHAYIAHRLRVAGFQGAPPFTGEAFRLISSVSAGIPRNVNSLCFNALTLGCARHRKTIDGSIIREVISDLEVVTGGDMMAVAPPRGRAAKIKPSQLLNCRGPLATDLPGCAPEPPSQLQHRWLYFLRPA